MYPTEANDNVYDIHSHRNGEHRRSALPSTKFSGRSFWVGVGALDTCQGFTRREQMSSGWEAFAVLHGHSKEMTDDGEHEPVLPCNQPSGWVRDSQAACCMNTKCGRRFGMLRRRHHCRSCGHVICEPCSRARVPLLHRDANLLRVGEVRPGMYLRICNDCVQPALMALHQATCQVLLGSQPSGKILAPVFEQLDEEKFDL